MPLLIFVVGLGLGLILGAFLGGIRTFTLTLDYEVTDRRSNSGEGKPAEEGAGGNVGQPSGSSDSTGGSGEFTGTAAGNLNGPGVTDPRTATSNEATIEDAVSAHSWWKQPLATWRI